MTYDKAISVLVKAGLLDQADAPAAAAVLDSASIEFAFPACD